MHAQVVAAGGDGVAPGRDGSWRIYYHEADGLWHGDSLAAARAGAVAQAYSAKEVASLLE
jgi:hypothetical protein